MATQSNTTSPELAKSRDAKDLCIVCEKRQEAPRKRGLCTTCYGRWRARKKDVAPTSRDRFDEACISRGALMPRRQGKDIGQPANIFDEIAEDFGADELEQEIEKKNGPRGRRGRKK